MSGMLKSKSPRQVSSGAGGISSVPGGAGAIGEQAVMSPKRIEPMMKRDLLHQHESNAKKHQAQPEKSKLPSSDADASQKQGHSV
jgi:hypothetical protein